MVFSPTLRGLRLSRSIFDDGCRRYTLFPRVSCADSTNRLDSLLRTRPAGALFFSQLMTLLRRQGVDANFQTLMKVLFVSPGLLRAQWEATREVVRCSPTEHHDIRVRQTDGDTLLPRPPDAAAMLSRLRRFRRDLAAYRKENEGPLPTAYLPPPVAPRPPKATSTDVLLAPSRSAPPVRSRGVSASQPASRRCQSPFRGKRPLSRENQNLLESVKAREARRAAESGDESEHIRRQALKLAQEFWRRTIIRQPLRLSLAEAQRVLGTSEAPLAAMKLLAELDESYSFTAKEQLLTAGNVE